MGRWRSLISRLTRRSAVGPDEVPVSHMGGIAAFYWVIIACVFSELAVLELLLPWELARLTSTVLHAAVLLLLLSANATGRMNPHLVVQSGLVVANGGSKRLLLPWKNVVAVQPAAASKGSGCLWLEVNGMTNVLITLDPPMLRGAQSGSSVALYADDPKGLAQAPSMGKPVAAVPRRARSTLTSSCIWPSLGCGGGSRSSAGRCATSGLLLRPADLGLCTVDRLTRRDSHGAFAQPCFAGRRLH